MHKKNPYIDALMASKHNYVEIGGVKWATCNLGAKNPWEPGLYFAWGETKGYTSDDVTSGRRFFGWQNYKFGQLCNLSKYNKLDEKTILDLEDDAVHANWGGNWRMPNVDDFLALRRSSNDMWVKNYNDSGMDGVLFTDNVNPNNVLFFPASGFAHGGSTAFIQYHAAYWVNSATMSMPQYGYVWSINYCTISFDPNYRDYGHVIRGVLDC